MQSYIPFGALIRTLFPTEPSIWSAIYLHAVKNVYPKNVYQTQETLFDNLDSFGIDCTNEQTLSRHFSRN